MYTNFLKTPIIHLKNVGLCYHPNINLFFKGKKNNKIWALKDVSFDVFKGDKLGIIGRNGSGKSTLMKLLAGIISHDRGKMKIISPNLNIQLLSLNTGMENILTGRENAILNGILFGKSRKYMLKRIEAIKEFSELGEFFEYPINTYSSGMKSRLGFSVAIEIKPDVLLLDEVLSVGDASFAKKSKEAIQKRFNSDQTVIFISHDEKLVNEFCNRAILIDKGKSIIVGDPEEVANVYKQQEKYY